MSLRRSRLILHWNEKIPNKSIFQTIFQKLAYVKILHQLVCHLYSLVPIAVADHKPARQIIALQSWFRRNRHFAFCLYIKGDVALYLHGYSTLACDIVFVTLLPIGRSRVIKKFSSWCPSKKNLKTYSNATCDATVTHDESAVGLVEIK